MVALLLSLIVAPEATCADLTAVELSLSPTLAAGEREELGEQLGANPSFSGLKICPVATPSGDRRSVTVASTDGEEFRISVARGEQVLGEREVSMASTKSTARALTLAIAVDELVRGVDFSPPAPVEVETVEEEEVQAPIVDESRFEFHGAVHGGFLGDSDSLEGLFELRGWFAHNFAWLVGARLGGLQTEFSGGRTRAGFLAPRIGVLASSRNAWAPFRLDLRASVDAPMSYATGGATDDPILEPRSDFGAGLVASGSLLAGFSVASVVVGPTITARRALVPLELRGGTATRSLDDWDLIVGLQLTW